MARDSIDRKELRQDQIHDALFWLVQWAYARRWLLGSALAAVLLAIAGVGGWQAWQAAQAREQANAFYELERRYLESQQTATQGELTDLEQARDGFAAFVEAHPDATLAPAAWMYLARIAWAQDDLDAAAEAFSTVRGHGNATRAQQQVARLGLAKVAEMRGNLDEAETLASGLDEAHFGALRAYTLGRLALQRNDTERAREHFQQAARAQPSTTISQWSRQALDYIP